MMTARATRNSFLTTFALLIFLLCLAVFQIAAFRVPPEQALNGKTGALSLGINLDLWNSAAPEKTSEDVTDIFRYNGLPISNTAVVLLLIAWQLGTYNYFMRKLARDGASFMES
jgi:hypothetical protein